MTLFNPYAPLPYKELELRGPYADRNKAILFMNPAPIYARLKIQPYNRRQSISTGDMWPTDNGRCACGCGIRLTGRRTRWASEKCAEIPKAIYFIITGSSNTIYYYLSLYHGNYCNCCGRTPEQIWKDHEHLPKWNHLRNGNYIFIHPNGLKKEALHLSL